MSEKKETFEEKLEQFFADLKKDAEAKWEELKQSFDGDDEAKKAAAQAELKQDLVPMPKMRQPKKPKRRAKRHRTNCSVCSRRRKPSLRKSSV
uniref:Uncharacterized protein n=1 Tax=Conchiformibius kuhniae TaxID=211502 RepID=A0A8T9MSQ4_9NEIS|nr:hypothetical protein LVJ77_10545 [Conchiformibius kuhniae]